MYETSINEGVCPLGFPRIPMKIECESQVIFKNKLFTHNASIETGV